MDCLGHYADLTFTVWAAICRTSACTKRFTWKSLDFHANDITGGIYFHTNSSHESFCHRGKSKLGIGLFIHELLREPLILPKFLLIIDISLKPPLFSVKFKLLCSFLLSSPPPLDARIEPPSPNGFNINYSKIVNDLKLRTSFDVWSRFFYRVRHLATCITSRRASDF